MKKQYPFLYRNGLTLAFMALFIVSVAAQAVTGLRDYNEFRKEEGLAPIGVGRYVGTGHFLQATFENWESEFLQMALFVMLTIFLRQAGSSESKSLDGKEDVDKEPEPSPDAPWPVKKGGWILSIYKHSLTIALFLLFIFSFIAHWYGSWIHFNEDQALKGAAQSGFIQYIGHSRFWFESFQNWQSEFLSVAAIVVLSIYLRQIGSPQTKPVDMPHSETNS
jgi:hypothetical protein